MDILKRPLAPITDDAWNEINTQAKRILKTLLSARKVIDIAGPKGWDYNSVPLGRIETPGGQKEEGIEYGIYKVQPLVEPRAFFELNIWELDNIERGAEDIDLQPMETAARKIAKFEENAIYCGFDAAKIKGLKDTSQYEPVEFSGEPEQFLQTVSLSITEFWENSVEGPYHLVVGPKLWRYLTSYVNGYPLRKHLENVLNGSVILNPLMEEAFIVSTRGGDLQLTLGQDLSIGYHSHNEQMVRLFFTESFTFRILDNSAYMYIQWKQK